MKPKDNDSKMEDRKIFCAITASSSGESSSSLREKPPSWQERDEDTVLTLLG